MLIFLPDVFPHRGVHRRPVTVMSQSRGETNKRNQPSNHKRGRPTFVGYVTARYMMHTIFNTVPASGIWVLKILRWIIHMFLVIP